MNQPHHDTTAMTSIVTSAITGFVALWHTAEPFLVKALTVLVLAMIAETGRQLVVRLRVWRQK